MLRKYVRRSAFACVSALAVIACLPNLSARMMGRAPSHSGYAAQQILEAAQPICEAISPHSECVTLKIEPGTSDISNPASRPCWLVDGIDKVGDLVVHLVYDATTGELIWAGRPVTQPETSAQGMMDRQEAERWGRSWLQALGIAKPGSQWRLVEAKKWREGNWSLSWQWGERTAYVILRGHTGELIVGKSNHQAPTALQSASKEY